MVHGRLPPGQQWVAAGRWPVVGERSPLEHVERWLVDVVGQVCTPRQWTLEQLQQLPIVEVTLDIHCVTRWSRPATTFRGVALETVLSFSEPLPDARFVSFVAYSSRGHSTSLPLETAKQLGVLLAWEADGQPLSCEHGGPIRVVTPERYFYKSLKWLRRIELLTTDRLGYWEGQAGYHNEADPWREQRYMAAALTKQQVSRLLASRDWRGRELRSVAVPGYDLSGLDAEGAVLRDADFRGAKLLGASFRNANLSNARFQQADLRGACFDGADVEGAHFEGADLRGARLVRVSLLGATFVPPPSTALSWPDRRDEAASVDATTLVSRQALDDLVPPQAHFLAQHATLVDDTKDELNR